MLRHMILMRHAKSSWKTDAPDDRSRPLNKRGRRDAPLVAAQLRELGWTPEVLLVSDSARTRETAERMLEVFRPAPRIEYVSSFYQGGIHEIREAVAGVSDEVASVLVLGHNPGWQAAVVWLTGRSVPMTTANAALLEASGTTWRDVLRSERSWHLVDVLRPKELIEGE